MNKNKIIQMIDKILLAIICVGLIISAFLIGSPLENNMECIITIINFMGLVYTILKIFLERKNIFLNNPVLILLMILLTSSFFSLIFRNMTSLSDTIKNILNLISIISLVVILVNNKTEDKIKYIISSIIISCLMLAIIGIDNLTVNSLKDIMKQLGNVDVNNIDARMMGNFGYANTFGICMALGFILTLGRYTNTESKISKIIYSILLVIFFESIILSYSRGTWISIFLIVLIYLWILKNNNKRIKAILILSSTTILGLIFYKIFTSNILKENYIVIFVCLSILSTLNGIIQIIFTKLIKVVEKIKIKYIISILVLLIFILIITFTILMQYKAPLMLFKQNYNHKEYTQEINYILLKNNHVKVEIEIDAESKYKNINTYSITINEKNKYGDILVKHPIEISNFKGIKELEFQKNEFTKYLSVTYKCLSERSSQGLEITSLRVNGEDAQLDYKYLPKEFVYKISNINIKVVAAWERGVFIKDGFKLALKHPFSGQGGNAWDYLQYSGQDYNYYTKEVHSYIVDIFIENGILGFLAILFLYIYLFIKFFKNIKKEDFSYIYLGILLILVHSIIDFDMSFIIIQFFVFSMIAVVNDEEIKLKNKISSKFLIFSYICVLLFGCILDTSEFWNNTWKKIDIYKDFDYIQTYEPYRITPDVIYIAKDSEIPDDKLYDIMVNLVKSKPKNLQNLVICYEILEELNREK